MKRLFCALGLLVIGSVSLTAQMPELKFIADTLVVQADGTYEADPDLATMTFQIFLRTKTSSTPTLQRPNPCSTWSISGVKTDSRGKM